MDVSPPPTEPPNIKRADDGVLDLGKERELRELRKRVELLTEELTNSKRTLIAPVSARMTYEEEHRKCGLHPQVIVSMETAEVTCQVCGAQLAPLDVLRDFARGERQFVQGLNHLREEASRLGSEVERLKKQRSSLRSQVRKKGGEVPDDPNCTRPSAREYFRLVRLCNQLQVENEQLKAKATP